MSKLFLATTVTILGISGILIYTNPSVDDLRLQLKHHGTNTINKNIDQSESSIIAKTIYSWGANLVSTQVSNYIPIITTNYGLFTVADIGNSDGKAIGICGKWFFGN